MSKGGVTQAKDVMSYHPPQGPTNIKDPKSPGIHGNVHPCGTQGPKGGHDSEIGHPGIGGSRKPHGSER